MREAGDHVGRCAGDEGVEADAEGEAAASGFDAGEAASELAGVGGAVGGIKEIEGGFGAGAAESGENECVEGTVLGEVARPSVSSSPDYHPLHHYVRS